MNFITNKAFLLALFITFLLPFLNAFAETPDQTLQIQKLLEQINALKAELPTPQ
jgi:hypothetical protein